MLANLSVISVEARKEGGAIGPPSFQLQTTRTGQRTYPRYTRIFNIRAGELIIIRKFQRRLIGDRRNYRRRLIKYPLLYNEYTRIHIYMHRREAKSGWGPKEWIHEGGGGVAALQLEGHRLLLVLKQTAAT